LPRYNGYAIGKVTGKQFIEARTNKLTYGFSFGSAGAEQHDASVREHRVLNEVRHAFIESQKSSPLPKGSSQNVTVGSPAQVLVHDRMGVMASQPQIFGEIVRQVFVDFELQPW
jgi:hypothetical protein